MFLSHKFAVTRLTKQPYRVVKMFDKHIGVYTLNNKRVVIKIEPSLTRVLKYEYDVLKKLEELGIDWTPKAYEYYEDDDDSCIVMEYIKSVTATEYLSNTDQWARFIKATLDILHQMNKLKITHYDFHSANMIVTKSPFKVYIIDWAYAHCPGVDPTDTELSVANVSTGMVPTCFDDIYDTCLFISSIAANRSGVFNSSEVIRSCTGFLPSRHYGYHGGREYVYDADKLYGTEWSKHLDSGHISHETATKYKQIMLDNRKYNFKDFWDAIKRDMSTVL